MKRKYSFELKNTDPPRRPMGASTAGGEAKLQRTQLVLGLMAKLE